MLTDFDQPRDRILWQIGSRKFPRPRDLGRSNTYCIDCQHVEPTLRRPS